MYCVKCGKQTDGSDKLCDECKAKEAEKNVALEVKTENEENTTMRSFGKSLASIIMGFGVFVVSCVLNTSAMNMNIIAMFFLMAIDIAAIVLAIVYGGKAIHTFSSYKVGGRRKPYPAFILGTIGVVLAGISAVITIVFLFVGLPNVLAAI